MTALKNRTLTSVAGAAVMVFAIQTARATGIDAFTPIDIMETGRNKRLGREIG